MKIYSTCLLIVILTHSPSLINNGLLNGLVEGTALDLDAQLYGRATPEEILAAIASIYSARLKKEISMQKDPIAMLAEEISENAKDSSCLYRNIESDILYENRTDFAKALKFAPSGLNCGKQFDITKLLKLVKKYSKLKPYTIGNDYPPGTKVDDNTNSDSCNSNGNDNVQDNHEDTDNVNIKDTVEKDDVILMEPGIISSTIYSNPALNRVGASTTFAPASVKLTHTVKGSVGTSSLKPHPVEGKSKLPHKMVQNKFANASSLNDDKSSLTVEKVITKMPFRKNNPTDIAIGTVRSKIQISPLRKQKYKSSRFNLFHKYHDESELKSSNKLHSEPLSDKLKYSSFTDSTSDYVAETEKSEFSANDQPLEKDIDNLDLLNSNKKNEFKFAPPVHDSINPPSAVIHP